MLLGSLLGQLLLLLHLQLLGGIAAAGHLLHLHRSLALHLLHVSVVGRVGVELELGRDGNLEAKGAG